MLFKKTLKVVSATALWMVALVGATSAMAQDEMLPTYSAEALTGAATATMYPVNGTGLIATVPVNERVAYYLSLSERDVHIRVDGGGILALGDAPTIALGTRASDVAATTAPTFGNEDTSGASGSGDSYRFELGAATPDVVALRVTLASTGSANVSGMGVGSVTVSAYDTQDDAQFGEGELRMSASANVLEVAPSVKVVVAAGSPASHTASAASRFRQLDSGPGTVSFGGFDIQVDETDMNADGMTLLAAAQAVDTVDALPDGNAMGSAEEMTQAAAKADAARQQLFGLVGIDASMSSSRFYGDGGFAFASALALNSAADCTGVGPGGAGTTGIATSPIAEVEEGEDPPNPNEVVAGIKIDPWYLCVTIDAENEEEIPEGAYDMDISLAAATPAGQTRPFAATGATALNVANIDHDGTTVQIPFVTSYEGYTQRIVIVNRNKVDVGFSLMFRAEGDGMIDGMNPYEGMAMAGTTTVVKVADLVTLTSPTRASATMTLLAAPRTVDVATTMVNKMDQSTDTVVLESR